jgi:hypothetical protein
MKEAYTSTKVSMHFRFQLIVFDIENPLIFQNSSLSPSCVNSYPSILFFLSRLFFTIVRVEKTTEDSHFLFLKQIVPQRNNCLGIGNSHFPGCQILCRSVFRLIIQKAIHGARKNASTKRKFEKRTI